MIDLFERLFNQVNKIGAQQEPIHDRDDVLVLIHLAKMMEENGEMVKDINTLIGLRALKQGENLRAIRENMIQEMGSVFQCLFLVAGLLDVSYTELAQGFDAENVKYQEWVEKQVAENKLHRDLMVANTHPMTCDRRAPECEVKQNPGDHTKEGILIPTTDGYVCPCGKYHQPIN